MSETKKSLKEKLNELLKKHTMLFGSEEIKFVDAKLNDGVTIIRLPNTPPLKGDVITVITEQGEMPLPDNAIDEPYVLEDGTTLTIVNGVVDTVIEAEKTSEDTVEGEVEEAIAPAMAAAAAAPKRVIKSQVEEHVFSVELENEIIEFDFSAMFKKQTDRILSLEAINLELTKTVNFLADEPATDGVEKIKVPVKKWEDMTPLEQYRAYKSK